MMFKADGKVTRKPQGTTGVGGLEAIKGRLLYDVEGQQGELLHADDGGGEKVVRDEGEGERRNVEQMRS